MKTTRIEAGRLSAPKWICVLALAAMPASRAEPEQAPEATGMRDAATHDTIVEASRVAKVEQARQEQQEAKLFLKPVPPEKRPKPPEPRSLLAVSDIICFHGLATMVPKRAVLHVPKNLADRIGMQDGAQFVAFDAFLAQNRAWLTNSPVSRVQAEGNEPLSEAVLKSFEKETRLVVATFQEGPISVLPLKVPPTPTADVK
ncbi:hypothetical protein [Luteolibacter sp. Populi]|uniref:hypothetical protein n=1 Tax=Luteolibacter sp. Populi TaxID=3230487 RepID=UPI00346554BD